MPSHSRYPLLIHMLLAVLLLAGCAVASPPVLPPVPTSTSTAPLAALSPAVSATRTQAPTLDPTPAATTAPQATARPRYQLSARLDYLRHTLAVSEDITWANPALQPLSTLVLVVEPNHYPGAFQLSAITSVDAPPPGPFELNDHRLDLPLAQPLAPGASITLHLDYSLTIPLIPPPADNRRPVPFGYTLRQTNLVDWYPYIAAYSPDSGWLVHKPWFYGEHQVIPAADFSVDLQLVDPPAGLVMAASTPETADSSGLHYRLEDSRAFALSASPDYVVASRQVGGVEVLSYSFAWDKVPGQAALDDTARALEYYGQLFGAYPHTRLSVVEADFLDGMEYEGLYFLSRGFYNLYAGTPKGYLTAIAVHETAHQWWYARVGNDQALEPWLDEGFSTYAERLYYEHFYPELSDWWWAFRIDFYKPVGWVNHPIYDYGGFTPYRNAVYLRGASFLEDLRIRIGDPAFFNLLRDYATLYAGQIATAEDFFALVKQQSPADISPLLKIYFDPTVPAVPTEMP